MTWVLATGLGAGLGAAYFGALWLSVRQVISRPTLAALVPLASLVRLALLGACLVILSRQGSASLAAALLGFWLSRWIVLRHLEGR
jgi:F1F0 ATPase subunit 2